MRILIVEDEMVTRSLMLEMLKPYGQCDTAADGEEAVASFSKALEDDEPYQLICFDIMMPKKTGQEALREVRNIESIKGISLEEEVKVIMTTAMGDPENVLEAMYCGGATAFLEKPVEKDILIAELKKLGLIPPEEE